MRLTAWEEERLLLFAAAELARQRRARGLRLNAPETVALICDEMLEAARGGAYHDAVVAAGLGAVAPDEVLDGVRELVDEVRLEVLLGDGTRLIVLVDPLGGGRPLANACGSSSATSHSARSASPHTFDSSGSTGASRSIARQRRASISTSPPVRPSDGHPASRSPSTSSASPAAPTDPMARIADEPHASARGAPGSFRTWPRRPDPPRRHGALGDGGRGP